MIDPIEITTVREPLPVRRVRFTLSKLAIPVTPPACEMAFCCSRRTNCSAFSGWAVAQHLSREHGGQPPV